MEDELNLPELGNTMTNTHSSDNYEVDKLTPEHAEEAYNVYMENNSIYDENLEMKIMSANSSYSQIDFLDICQDDKTAAIMVSEKIAMEENYTDGLVFVNMFRGFLVYEALFDKEAYSIVFMEAENKKDELAYTKLLNYLKGRLSVSKRCNKILIEIEENRDDLMKVVFANEFHEQSFIASNSDKPDIFIFEYGAKPPTTPKKVL